VSVQVVPVGSARTSTVTVNTTQTQVVDVGTTNPGTGGIVAFRWDQTTAASVWGPIVHGLGRFPAAVSLFSLDLSEQYAEFVVQHIDTNTLRISTDLPCTGVALIE